MNADTPITTARNRSRRLTLHLVRALPLIVLIGVVALAAPRCRRTPPAAAQPARPAACCAPGVPTIPASLPVVDTVTTASTKLFSFGAAADTWTTQSF